jgi:hypothetical protein
VLSLTSFAGEASPAQVVALPGTQVQSRAICIGFGGDREEKVALAWRIWNCRSTARGYRLSAGGVRRHQWRAYVPARQSTQWQRWLKSISMYVICPIREQAGSEQYNTAVLLDREGHVAGQYRKVFVFWGEDVLPSRDGVKAFDTDFGRISILTCFDLNFPELWQQADLLDVDIVFWPSAYTGGSPLNVMATFVPIIMLCRVGAGNIIDATGQTLEKVEQRELASTSRQLTSIELSFIRTLRKRRWKSSFASIKTRSSKKRFQAPKAWSLLRSLKPGIPGAGLCVHNTRSRRCANISTAADNKSTRPARKAKGYDERDERREPLYHETPKKIGFEQAQWILPFNRG